MNFNNLFISWNSALTSCYSFQIKNEKKLILNNQIINFSFSDPFIDCSLVPSKCNWFINLLSGWRHFFGVRITKVETTFRGQFCRKCLAFRNNLLKIFWYMRYRWYYVKSNWDLKSNFFRFVDPFCQLFWGFFPQRLRSLQQIKRHTSSSFEEKDQKMFLNQNFPNQR